jgi:hypothetical protein
MAQPSPTARRKLLNNMSSFCTDALKIAQTLRRTGLSITDAFEIFER